MRLLLTLFFFSVVAVTGREPQFEGIAYENPEQYLNWPSNLGDEVAIRLLATSLKGKTKKQTVRQILQWMEHNLRYDGKKAYAWRNFDDVMREKVYGSCADQAIVCGVLLKAAEIPCIWVKTMDVPWIWDLKNERDFKAWSGHVFLEVFMDGQWMLLDPGSQTLFANYHPKARLFPGNRFAYDKGNDPKEMVMSLQWEEWKKQTKAHFSALDETLLPVDPTTKKTLKQVAYVAANSPSYQVITKLAQEEGLHVLKSFNNDYDRYLSEAKGHLLFVETIDGKPIIPREILERHYPGAVAKLKNEETNIKIAGTSIIFVDIMAQFKPLLDGHSD